MSRDRDNELSWEDLIAGLGQVNSLDFDAAGRYWDTPDGNSFCVWIDQLAPSVHLRIGMVRRNALPDVERLGRLSALRLAENAGLSELTHIVIFPDRMAGVEYNFYGPRVGALGSYLENKTDLVPLSFLLLLRRDVEAALSRFRDVRLLRLRLRRTDATLMREADPGGLGAELDAALEKLDAPVIEVVLRNTQFSRQPLPDRFLDFVKNLVRHPRTRETFDVLKMKGFNQHDARVEEIDLLGDALISSQQVVRQGQRRRSLRRDSVYSAIATSYRQLRDLIQDAAGLGR
jgi:hypothetical protein